MRKSKYLRERLLNWAAKDTAFGTPPTGLWLAAFSTLPDIDDDDTAVEVSYTGYGRVDFIGQLGALSGTSAATLQNNLNGNENDDIIFAEIPDGEGPITPVGFGVYDDETAGNLLWVADTPDLPSQGQQEIGVPAGLLRIEER